LHLVRRALLVILLAACSAPASRGPAWPKLADREVDGGESLAPHTASTVEGVVEVSEDTEEDGEAEDKPAAAAPAKAETPTGAASGSSATPEEPITTEDIVIEVEDD
jgi:hypothetical protein